MVNAFYSKGADAVLGFIDEIIVEETNLWTEVFMVELSSGCTIDYAMSKADQAVKEDPYCAGLPYYSTSEKYRHLVGSGSSRPCN